MNQTQQTATQPLVVAENADNDLVDSTPSTAREERKVEMSHTDGLKIDSLTREQAIDLLDEALGVDVYDDEDDDDIKGKVLRAVEQGQISMATINEVVPDTKNLVSDADETRALALRAQALALLEQAEAIDGLQPFVVTHGHGSGTSSYLAWAKSEPNEVQAASVLDAEFEPDLEEWLAIESNITLDDLTGVSVSSRVVEQEEANEYDAPSPGM